MYMTWPPVGSPDEFASGNDDRVRDLRGDRVRHAPGRRAPRAMAPHRQDLWRARDRRRVPRLGDVSRVRPLTARRHHTGIIAIVSYEHLLLERDGAVLTITINRPAVLNALNAATLDELG